MRIKKFNELFDTEDLKSKNEIGYLKGDLAKDLVKNVKPFRSELFTRINERIIAKYPFFEYCFDHNRDTTKFGCKNKDNIYHYYFKDDKYYLQLSIVVHQHNDYDLIILIKDLKSDKVVFFDDYIQLDDYGVLETIRYSFIDKLVKYDFGELIKRSKSAKPYHEN